MDAISPVQTLPRRDRAAILTGLSGITVLAWLYLFHTARLMSRMPSMPDMPDMVMLRSWTGMDFLLTFLMWAVMMVGMMVPTATPMTLVYAAIARRAAGQNSPLAPTTVFVAGYTATWTLFSLAATLVQWVLEEAALLSPMMVSTSPSLGAGILISAGIYQLTPLKSSCLKRCQSPFQFFSERWRDGIRGAFRMGFVHGAFCLGCCGFLMMLLFLGGVMNLLWIAVITIFILAEKLSPPSSRGGKIAGLAMILLGILALAGFRV